MAFGANDGSGFPGIGPGEIEYAVGLSAVCIRRLLEPQNWCNPDAVTGQQEQQTIY
jgi:hypothetical protein